MSQTVTLDENGLKDIANDLFEGATPAQKKVAPVVALRNDSSESIKFNVVLKDGTVENEGASIPPNGIAVVQVGGEINVMSDFEHLYEDVTDGVNAELAGHANTALNRAGVEAGQASALTRLTAVSKQRVDQFVKLPSDENGQSVDFVIMKPWGENGSLIAQNAKSGDVLVMNGQNGSLYFNSLNGTLANFVNATTGNPIPNELETMKTAPMQKLNCSR